MGDATKADFDRLDVGALLLGVKPTCSNFAGVLDAKWREVLAAEDRIGAAVLSLLSDVCSYGLRPADRQEPFGPRLRGDGCRTPIPSDLDDPSRVLLADIYDTISVSELRARVADVLFVLRRHQKFGQVALDAYLESAEVLMTPEHWAEASYRLERALTITLSLKPERDRVASVITRAIENRKGDSGFFSAKMMQALLEARLGDPSTMATLAEEAAKKAITDGAWDRAREYFLLFAQWSRKLGKPDDDVRAKREAAECYVKLADAAGSRSLEASFLERAIQSLRTLASTQARVEALHVRLIAAEREAPKEFKEHSSSVELGDAPARARSHVGGVPLLEAIARLSGLAWPPPIATIREGVIAAAKNALLFNAMPRVMMNRHGKVMGKRGSLLAGTPDQQAEAHRQAMFERARQLREIFVVSTIEPARAQIAEEHFISIRELLPLVTASAFVPADREVVFALGLAAGFNGDYAVALHVLMPQFENAIRTILAQAGTITSKIADDGVQDERDLGWLLYCEDAKRIFGEDLVFEMQGLLVERFGGNLRNQMAHGLLDVAEMIGLQSIYFWWLTLDLVVRPLLRTSELPAETGSDASTATATESDVVAP